MPVAGRGSPPARRIPAACGGRLCLSLDGFFPAGRAWHPGPASRRRPARRGLLAACAGQSRACLALALPQRRPRRQLPWASRGRAGGDDAGDPGWVGGCLSWGPQMLSLAQPHEEEEDARPHEEDAQPLEVDARPHEEEEDARPLEEEEDAWPHEEEEDAQPHEEDAQPHEEEEDARPRSPQLGLAVEPGTLRYGGPRSGGQPHAVGPGPAPGQPQDPKRLQHPKASPPAAAPVPSERARAEQGPDGSNGKAEPGGHGAHRPPRHKAALDAAPPLTRAASSSSSSHPARALGAPSIARARGSPGSPPAPSSPQMGGRCPAVPTAREGLSPPPVDGVTPVPGEPPREVMRGGSGVQNPNPPGERLQPWHGRSIGHAPRLSPVPMPWSGGPQLGVGKATRGDTARVGAKPPALVG